MPVLETVKKFTENATGWARPDRDDLVKLVRARLHAGRAHQVRAHLAAAGFPILGDPIYGPAASAALGLRLHAHTVSLAHPTTGRPLLIEAPPPAWAILTA